MSQTCRGLIPIALLLSLISASAGESSRESHSGERWNREYVESLRRFALNPENEVVLYRFSVYYTTAAVLEALRPGRVFGHDKAPEERKTSLPGKSPFAFVAADSGKADAVRRQIEKESTTVTVFEKVLTSSKVAEGKNSFFPGDALLFLNRPSKQGIPPAPTTTENTSGNDGFISGWSPLEEKTRQGLHIGLYPKLGVDRKSVKLKINVQWKLPHCEMDNVLSGETGADASRLEVSQTVMAARGFELTTQLKDGQAIVFADMDALPMPWRKPDGSCMSAEECEAMKCVVFMDVNIMHYDDENDMRMLKAYFEDLWPGSSRWPTK